MIISPPTNAFSEIGTVAQSIFDSVSPAVIMIIGILLAFFVVEMIIDSVSYRSLNEKVDRELERSRKLIE